MTKVPMYQYIQLTPATLTRVSESREASDEEDRNHESASACVRKVVALQLTCLSECERVRSLRRS